VEGEGEEGVPGGEDLDGLRDGEGEHGGDERAVGEHGQVGERGRCGRRGGGGGGSGSSSFGRRGQCSAPAASYGSLSSARRGSDSRAGVLQCGEVESDEEVQSSYKGPFDTMDALQDALPNKRSAQSAKARAFVNLVPVIRNRSGFDLLWILRWIMLAFTTSCAIRCTADSRGHVLSPFRVLYGVM